MAWLRSDIEDILPGTVNTVRGAVPQVLELGRPSIVRRDTFEDILTDVEDKVPTTPQRQVWFADVATSTPVLRPMEQGTQTSRTSQVPSTRQGLFEYLEPQKNLYEEGFSYSLQAATTEFRKL